MTAHYNPDLIDLLSITVSQGVGFSPVLPEIVQVSLFPSALQANGRQLRSKKVK